MCGAWLALIPLQGLLGAFGDALRLRLELVGLLRLGLQDRVGAVLLELVAVLCLLRTYSQAPPPEVSSSMSGQRQ